LKKKYKSKFEGTIASLLEALNIPIKYEALKIQFIQPAKLRTYNPDWVLPNNIIVETKGRFVPDDRQKHLWIREQHPDLDIRFVFQNASNTITKRSKVTYADWCDKNGFIWAESSVPEAWLSEPARPALPKIIKIKGS
jgi:hypothetical protein